MKPTHATLLAASAALLALLSAAPRTSSAQSDAALPPWVGADGAIRLPADFRREMVHLGSWFVPEGDASGFHDVYAGPEAVDAYRATGAFPDGATLVKELRPARTADYTTGRGVSHATGDVKQWFVMVKDARGRFPEDPRWAEGWGWALFRADDPTKNVAKSFEADCLGCHAPARPNDWVYGEGYPTLRGRAEAVR